MQKFFNDFIVAKHHIHTPTESNKEVEKIVGKEFNFIINLNTFYIQHANSLTDIPKETVSSKIVIVTFYALKVDDKNDTKNT